MAQEFTINSSAIETKINQLLPSQGGFGAGIDFSASTMVIPIVDLTETAEGSGLRQDLQRSASLTSNTNFNVGNATTTIISTTGYYSIKGGVTCTKETSGTDNLTIKLTDGTTTKTIYGLQFPNFGIAQVIVMNVELDVFIKAGESCVVTAGSQTVFDGSTRQIADLSANLVNPL